MTALGQSRRFGSFSRISGHWAIQVMVLQQDQAMPMDRFPL
jgi:hypothetical protein